MSCARDVVVVSSHVDVHRWRCMRADSWKDFISEGLWLFDWQKSPHRQHIDRVTVFSYSFLFIVEEERLYFIRLLNIELWHYVGKNRTFYLKIWMLFIKSIAIESYQNNFFIIIFFECYFVSKKDTHQKQEQKQQQQQQQKIFWSLKNVRVRCARVQCARSPRREVRREARGRPGGRVPRNNLAFWSLTKFMHKPSSQ